MNLSKRKRLNTAIQSIYDTLKIAHSESIKRKADITVAFTNGTSWCFALTDIGDCNCKTGTCTIDGTPHVTNAIIQ